MKRIITILSIAAILAGAAAMGWTWDDHAKKATVGFFDGD